MLYIKSVDPCEKKTTNVLKEKNDMVENLKCCGNCGNNGAIQLIVEDDEVLTRCICGVLPVKSTLCDKWIYDGKNKEERIR